MKRFLMVISMLGILTITGCYHTYYYNPSLRGYSKSEIKYMLESDKHECKALAERLAPMPVNPETKYPTYTTRGTIMGSNGEYYDYSATTRRGKPSFSEDVDYFVGVLNSIVAKPNIYRKCMKRKGWHIIRRKAN